MESLRFDPPPLGNEIQDFEIFPEIWIIHELYNNYTSAAPQARKKIQITLVKGKFTLKISLLEVPNAIFSRLRRAIAPQAKILRFSALYKGGRRREKNQRRASETEFLTSRAKTMVWPPLGNWSKRAKGGVKPKGFHWWGQLEGFTKNITNECTVVSHLLSRQNDF